MPYTIGNPQLPAPIANGNKYNGVSISGYGNEPNAQIIVFEANDAASTELAQFASLSSRWEYTFPTPITNATVWVGQYRSSIGYPDPDAFISPLREVTLDNVAPTLTVTGPTSPQPANAPFTVEIQASEAVGVFYHQPTGVMRFRYTPAIAIGANASGELEESDIVVTGGTVVPGSLVRSPALASPANMTLYATESQTPQWTVQIQPNAGVASVEISVPSGAVADEATNGNLASNMLTVGIIQPSLGIGPIYGDDYVDNYELTVNMLHSGTAVGMPDGTVLTVSVNGGGTPVQTTVNNGNWEVQTIALGITRASTLMTVTDGNGVTATRPFTVQQLAPTITIYSVAGNDNIEVGEDASGIAIEGTSTDIPVGSVLTVSWGASYTTTTTVTSNSGWSVAVLPSDVPTGSVSGVTVSGGGASASRVVTRDATVPTVQIDPVTGDDFLSLSEQRQDLTISGTTTYTPAGTSIAVTYGSFVGQATVLANGTWSLIVPSYSVPNAYGTVYANNPAGAAATRTVNVESAPNIPLTVAIGVVAGNDNVDQVERAAGVTISGTTTGANQGDTVVVTWGSKTYVATVGVGGNWAVVVPTVDIPTKAEVVTATIGNAVAVRIVTTTKSTTAAYACNGVSGCIRKL